MFVVYVSSNEILVTTEELETEMLRIWFTQGGRDLDDYDLSIIQDEAVEITTTFQLG